jgi:hypothetical protein
MEREADAGLRLRAEEAAASYHGSVVTSVVAGVLVLAAVWVAYELADRGRRGR